MTGHHHEPFDRDAAAPPESARVADAVLHRRMWIAAGVTMVAIVALWATLLPGQLANRNATMDAEAERFAALRLDAQHEAFNAQLAGVRESLDAAARALEESATVSADDPYAEGIQRLHERLDAATESENGGGSDAAGNAGAATGTAAE